MKLSVLERRHGNQVQTGRIAKRLVYAHSVEKKRNPLRQTEQWRQCKTAKEQVRKAVIENGNTFEVLMEAVRYCSLGQITQTLFEVGGRYRRNM